jgi:anti-sigma B factor antagonist
MNMPESYGTEPFEIAQLTRADGSVVVTVRGELDLATSPALEAVLRTLASERRPAVLDLSELRFIDSSGLRLVLLAAADASRDDWSFALAPELSHAVERLFGLAGVHDRLRFDGPRP